MIDPSLPPEGTLDPQQPWYKGKLSDAHWDRFKAKLTGGRDAGGTSYFSMVEGGVTNADADRIINNMKKDPRGYPQMDQANPAALYEYQNWIVSEYLEKPFREETDKKIQEYQDQQRIKELEENQRERREQKKAVQAIADTLNKKPDAIQDPWGEGTVPAKQYAVVPTTKLLPPAKEVAEEKKPEAKKRGSTLVKSMTKTFARMEDHFQKLTELSATSESNVSGITDAFRIQSDALVKGFQDTTAVVNKVASAVNLQASTMVRIAKGKKDLDQKNLDAQEALSEETALEGQNGAAGNSAVKSFNKKPPGGKGGGGGAIGKALGSAVIAKLVGGKGLKLAAKMGSKLPAKVTQAALTKAVGRETSEYIARKVGGKAIEAGVERGIVKGLGKKVPFLGLGLGAFFAVQRAMKGDLLGATLEIASGASSMFPGVGTAGSLALDAALAARDTGAVPFEKGGLTQKSTFTGNKKRPGVTDLSPKLFQTMYEGEIKYEHKNKGKFAILYADGYEKYFDNPSFPDTFGSFMTNFVDFFKDWTSNIGSGLRSILPDMSGGESYSSEGGESLSNYLGGADYGQYNPQGPGSRRSTRIHSADGRFMGHTGEDYPMPVGKPLTFVAPGTVVDVARMGDERDTSRRKNNGGYGHFLVVKLDDGMFVKMAHLSEIFVRKGDRVGAGTASDGRAKVVAKSGNTGLSTAPHLHMDYAAEYNPGSAAVNKTSNPKILVDRGAVVVGQNVKATTPERTSPADTTSPTSSRAIPATPDNSKPKVVVIAGNNDFNTPHAVEGIKKMIAELHGKGYQVVFVPPSQHAQSPRRQLSIAMQAAAVEAGAMIEMATYKDASQDPSYPYAHLDSSSVSRIKTKYRGATFIGDSNEELFTGNAAERGKRIQQLLYRGRALPRVNQNVSSTSNSQTTQFLAMAGLEEQIRTTTVTTVRVNRESAVVIPSQEPESTRPSVSERLKQLYLREIG